MKVYTIGFTHKPAELFFGLLKGSGAARIVDVRLRNDSQLAGFAKKKDLAYFARALCGMEYVHLPELAPTPDLLDTAHSKRPDWAAWERDFLALMAARGVEASVPRDLIDDGVLLCTEATPEHCHRRLVAEYLAEKWGGMEIVHLG